MTVYKFQTVLNLLDEEPRIDRIYRYVRSDTKRCYFAVFLPSQDDMDDLDPNLVVFELLYDKRQGGWTELGKMMFSM